MSSDECKQRLLAKAKQMEARVEMVDITEELNEKEITIKVRKIFLKYLLI